MNKPYDLYFAPIALGISGWVTHHIYTEKTIPYLWNTEYEYNSSRWAPEVTDTESIISGVGVAGAFLIPITIFTVLMTPFFIVRMCEKNQKNNDPFENVAKAIVMGTVAGLCLALPLAYLNDGIAEQIQYDNYWGKVIHTSEVYYFNDTGREVIGFIIMGFAILGLMLGTIHEVLKDVLKDVKMPTLSKPLWWSSPKTTALDRDAQRELRELNKWA